LVIIGEWGWDFGCGLLAMLKVFFVHAQEVCCELLHHGEGGRVFRAQVVRKWWWEGLLAGKVV
jgi:hypothetical protein